MLSRGDVVVFQADRDDQPMRFIVNRIYTATEDVPWNVYGGGSAANTLKEVGGIAVNLTEAYGPKGEERRCYINPLNVVAIEGALRRI